MSNPLLQQNPFMSMWLSTANRMAGSFRGQAAAQAKRHAKTALTKATNENIKLWSDAVTPAAVRSKRRR